MQEKLCLFCLEDIKEQQMGKNSIGCGCELLCHETCMQTWIDTKNQLECPICHAVSVPNTMFQRQEPMLHSIHVNSTPNSASELEQKRFQEKCALWCCFSLLFWCLFVNILTYF